MFSFVGDTVLDPFAGSGTTNLAAKKLDRNSIAYEINPEFIPVIKEKLDFSQIDIHGTTYELLTQEISNNFDKDIQKLTYIFTDPHRLDKKVDPKKLQYGSKIDKNGSNKREDLFSVKEVLGPTKIRLSNDLIIKLLGIKEIPNLSEKATDFLESKIKNKKVFLKYDSTKYDKNNNLLCYLYLENKTFINAHLIKNQLVDVDNSSDYKYKIKFLNLIK
jgi:site-specific DNA-methyltransferase (adenine-specific)